MKAVVIGLGSMGKRRIRLLQEHFPSVSAAGVDTQEARRAEAASLFAIPTFSSLTIALREAGADCAFVCTAPLSHAGIISDCLDAGLHVFTELNLVADGYTENIRKAEKQHRVLFLSSTFLYREEIQYIQKCVMDTRSPVNYVYHVGQYLPDWHPWEDYTQFFVGDKRTNGCREIFAVEFPWLLKTFGQVEAVHIQKSRLSGLRIDYPDNYLLQLTHADGHKGLLAVDVLSRKAVRNLEIYNEGLYLCWDGSPDGLYEYSAEKKAIEQVTLYRQVERQEGYSRFIIENAYANEIRAFFAQMEDGQPPLYSFAEDLQTLSLADRIEAEP